MKTTIQNMLAEIKNKQMQILSSDLLDQDEKDEALGHLDNAIKGLREAKFYIGLCEPNLGYELTRILD